jgi:hypothetical protein
MELAWLVGTAGVRGTNTPAAFSYYDGVRYSRVGLLQEALWRGEGYPLSFFQRDTSVIIPPKRADSPGVKGTRKDAMAINSCSSVSTVPPASGNPQSTIASLERQLTQVEKKINEVSRDQSLSAEAKQEELALYQAQEQLIEAQIQQIQQQQEQQEQQSMARAAAKQETGGTPSNKEKTTKSLIDVVA